jgi:subtilisin family serine protease
MKREVGLVLIFFLILTVITSVVALDLSQGESEASAIHVLDDEQNTDETSADAIDIPLLDSPKIQELLRQEAEAIGSGDIDIIVVYSDYVSSNEKEEIHEMVTEITYEYSIIPAAAFSIRVSALDDLAALSFVETVEYDADTIISLAQSTTQIGASRIWLSHGVGGEGIVVAVLDTGIDNEHPDLQNIVSEKDFTGEGTDDKQGHGTHVASTIAGSGSASAGLNKGVAPKASLMDVKVLDSTGMGKLSDTIAGIQWAVLNGADVISMSLGAQIPCNGLDATSLASDAAVKQGVHVVVAAGNTGPIPGTVGSPGCAHDVITVGAVDRLDNVAVFSSRGPTLDGRTKPDILAPGVLIIAAKNGGGYTALSGTSMATPHISGVVALILSENPNLSAEQVKEVLMNTAKDLGEDENTQGAGRVEAYDAFIAATGLEPQDPPEDEDNEESKVPEESDQNNEGKEKAKEKSKDEGHVDDVEKVYEDDKDGKEYYVVEGTKEDKPNKVIQVWVSQESGEIKVVKELGYFGQFWSFIVSFFDSIVDFFR